MKIKKKNTLKLRPKRYANSLGAKAMGDDLPRKMERSAFNYLDVDVNDPEFADANPFDFSVQFQQFALFNAGIKLWDQNAEIYQNCAQQAKLLDDPATHPVWLGMMRHAQYAPSREVAEKFLSHAIFKPSIDHKSWDGLPDTVKLEGVLRAATLSREIPKRIKTEVKATEFFIDKIMLTGALLSLGEYYIETTNTENVLHCVDLIKSVNPGLYNLQKGQHPSFLFHIVNLMYYLNENNGDFSASMETLLKAWGVLKAKKVENFGYKMRYEAMRGLYDKRVKTAAQLSDSELGFQTRKDWSDYISSQVQVLTEITS